MGERVHSAMELVASFITSKLHRLFPHAQKPAGNAPGIWCEHCSGKCRIVRGTGREHNVCRRALPVGNMHLSERSTCIKQYNFHAGGTKKPVFSGFLHAEPSLRPQMDKPYDNMSIAKFTQVAIVFRQMRKKSKQDSNSAKIFFRNLC